MMIVTWRFGLPVLVPVPLDRRKVCRYPKLAKDRAVLRLILKRPMATGTASQLQEVVWSMAEEALPYPLKLFWISNRVPSDQQYQCFGVGRSDKASTLWAAERDLCDWDQTSIRLSSRMRNDEKRQTGAGTVRNWSSLCRSQDHSNCRKSSQRTFYAPREAEPKKAEW